MGQATGSSTGGSQDGPVFVVGASRSGTTLMRLILNAHPRIAIPDETAMFVKLFESFRQGTPWPRIVDDAIALLDERLRPPIELGPVRDRLLALTEPRFGALLELPLSAWARQEGKVRWGEKTPEHIFFSEPIVAMFPQARFVEMIRDPRAVVASMTRSQFKGDDPTRNALYWNYVVNSAHPELHRHASADRVHTVRYETLVTEPEQTVRGVCAFLSEQFTPEMLAFHERSDAYLSNQRASDDPRLGQAVSADLDGWRRTLSARQLAVTERICGESMERLGYPRAGGPVTAAQRAAIVAQQAYVGLKRYQQRDRHYQSFTGPIGGGLARRARAVLSR